MYLPVALAPPGDIWRTSTRVCIHHQHGYICAAMATKHAYCYYTFSWHIN